MEVRWRRNVCYLTLLIKHLDNKIVGYIDKYADFGCFPGRRNKRAACASFHGYRECRLVPGQKGKTSGHVGIINPSIIRPMA